MWIPWFARSLNSEIFPFDVKETDVQHVWWAQEPLQIPCWSPVLLSIRIFYASITPAGEYGEHPQHFITLTLQTCDSTSRELCIVKRSAEGSLVIGKATASPQSRSVWGSMLLPLFWNCNQRGSFSATIFCFKFLFIYLNVVLSGKKNLLSLRWRWSQPLM